MRLAALFLLFLASALSARQKYKGAPPEALHTAILHGGGVEGVDHELKRGAKLKGRDAQSRTALHAAASIGDAEVAAALVKKFAAKGLDLLDAGDANNATALIYAADAGHRQDLPAVWLLWLRKRRTRTARARVEAARGLAAAPAQFHTRLF